MEIWPDNETAYQVFKRIGTRWRYPAMGGAPMGFEWSSVYPLMDRLGLDNAAWSDLHDALMQLEVAAMEVIKEAMPKPAET